MNSFQGNEILHNVYQAEFEGKTRIFTRSPYPSHYGERKIGEYREWIPYRSKLGAMLIKGHIPEIKRDMKFLYLGTASGTTASHISDILDKGVLYGVEYSAKPFQKFIRLAMERKNIIPILSDAETPEKYSGIVEKVDFIYQDIAQRNQVEIFVKNFQFFAKKNALGLIFVKARSIDSTAEVKEIYGGVIKYLEEKFEILDWGDLVPYHKDHIFVYVRWMK